MPSPFWDHKWPIFKGICAAEDLTASTSPMYRQFRTSTSPGSRRHPQHLEIIGTSYIEAFSKKHVICIRGSHALLHFPQIPSTDAGCSGPKRRHCLCLDIFYLFYTCYYSACSSMYRTVCTFLTGDCINVIAGRLVAIVYRRHCILLFMTGLSVLQIRALVKLHSTTRTSRTESLFGCQGDVRAKSTMSCVQKTPWTWQMWLSELWLRGKNLSLLQRRLSQLSQLFRKRPWLNPYHSYVKSVRYRWDTMRHLFFHLFSSTYVLVRSFGRWNLESIQCCLQMYPQHGYMWQLYPSLVPWPIRQWLNAIHYIHQSGCSWRASRKMKIDPPHRGGKEGNAMELRISLILFASLLLVLLSYVSFHLVHLVHLVESNSTCSFVGFEDRSVWSSVRFACKTIWQPNFWDSTCSDMAPRCTEWSCGGKSKDYGMLVLECDRWRGSRRVWDQQDLADDKFLSTYNNLQSIMYEQNKAMNYKYKYR